MTSPQVHTKRSWSKTRNATRRLFGRPKKEVFNYIDRHYCSLYPKSHEYHANLAKRLDLESQRSKMLTAHSLARTNHYLTASTLRSSISTQKQIIYNSNVSSSIPYVFRLSPSGSASISPPIERKELRRELLKRYRTYITHYDQLMRYCESHGYDLSRWTQRTCTAVRC